MTTAEYVGSEIARRRRAQGYSQDALAAHLGINRSTVSRVEAGLYALSVTRLVEIAGWLGVRPVRLLPEG